MNGGKENKSPRSEGRAQGGESIAPHGSSRNRRSSSKERGDADGDAQSPESEWVMVRVSHGGEKWAQLDWAELAQPNPLGLV
jgi:hypothetical protein